MAAGPSGLRTTRASQTKNATVGRGDHPPDVSGANPASIDKDLERARADGYDMVVIDTAPHADHAALQAARAADLVAIPCRPSTFDIAAISATLDLCKLANKQPWS
jgi:chromosome partitioning protein